MVIEKSWIGADGGGRRVVNAHAGLPSMVAVWPYSEASEAVAPSPSSKCQSASRVASIGTIVWLKFAAMSAEDRATLHTRTSSTPPSK